MVLGSGFTRLLWLVLLAGVLMAFGGERAEAEEDLASWYGPGFEGRPTASGETYDPNGLTAAHKTLPLGTEILVSYGGRTVPVTINDRGPFTGGRDLDLSQGAARELGLTQVGVDYVDWTLANGTETGLTPQQVAQEPAPAAALQPELAPADTGTGYVEGAYPSYPRSYPPVQETASGGSAYTVQPGDTLAGISARLGATADYLASRNGITDPNLIYSGQALYYPLVLEDPTGAGEHSTTDGAMTQSPPNVGGGAIPDGGTIATPVYENVTSAFVDGTASPMAP